MPHLPRSMTLAAVAAAFVTIGGCAPKGRVTVDMAHQTLTSVPQGQPLIAPPSGPLAANRPRYWTVEGDVPLPTTQASEGPPSTRVADASKIKIGNFGQVNANYYRGGEPRDGDYAALAALGIRTVIDLQADGGNDHEAQLVEAAGMTFHRIPMATRVAPTLEQIAQFMTIVTNPAHQPVYVHCAGGKHRTGVMTAVYRIEHDGWTADQAYQEMKRYKFGSSIWHPEFKDFVYRYQPLRMYVVRTVPKSTNACGRAVVVPHNGVGGFGRATTARRAKATR